MSLTTDQWIAAIGAGFAGLAIVPSVIALFLSIGAQRRIGQLERSAQQWAVSIEVKAGKVVVDNRGDEPIVALEVTSRAHQVIGSLPRLNAKADHPFIVETFDPETSARAIRSHLEKADYALAYEDIRGRKWEVRPGSHAVLQTVWLARLRGLRLRFDKNGGPTWLGRWLDRRLGLNSAD